MDNLFCFCSFGFAVKAKFWRESGNGLTVELKELVDAGGSKAWLSLV